ncbi:unnamed protein product [Onchocerca flexuosa]|uniref:DUF3475 domain-containing protein n=1 Tax=Onchocerca flexuosa TaxID=387005 RepID=A0A183I2T2_9BILA|nr:unnamed protein product [Onchocerca flexuosa]
MSSDKFLEQYKNQCLEVKMTSLVAALTKTCGTLNDLVTKMNVMSMERQSWLIASGRRARPFPANAFAESLLENNQEQTTMLRTTILKSSFSSLLNSLRCLQMDSKTPEKIVNRKCDKKVVEVFDDLSNEICSAADLVSLIVYLVAQFVI